MVLCKEFQTSSQKTWVACPQQLCQAAGTSGLQVPYLYPESLFLALTIYDYYFRLLMK